MPLVEFSDLMLAAEKGDYAVGYFESWDMSSLFAICDAAIAARSPVLLGFSGFYLNHQESLVSDPLSAYAASGLEICRRMPVPAALVYNESPDPDAVLNAARLGFGLVMFSDLALDAAAQKRQVRALAKEVHPLGAAVEGEIAPVPGMGTIPVELDNPGSWTDIAAAREYVDETGVDALAVNLGQMHLHGRSKLSLDLDLLRDLKKALSIPLVLHAATSIKEDDLRSAARLGVRKINVSSRLKQSYFEALRQAAIDAGPDYNPYIVIGSGLAGDVQVAARFALRDVVIKLMGLFGSAGKA